MSSIVPRHFPVMPSRQGGEMALERNLFSWPILRHSGSDSTVVFAADFPARGLLYQGFAPVKGP